MTAAVVVALLAVVAIAYVVRPIGRNRTPFIDESEPDNADDKKRVALTAILDLEEERDGGKLSEAEFRALRARYEHDAVAALRELDQRTTGSELESQLEREIASARDRLRCRTCGAPRSDGERCPSCGSPY